MAIVTAFRFTEKTGAICIDQESWHIWRRKNWFTDHLYSLIPEEYSDRYGVALAYGGPGHPPFHFEAAERARVALTHHLSQPDLDPALVTVPQLSKIVLDAFTSVHHRRINDKLHFLFGIDMNDYNAGRALSCDDAFDIVQKDVRARAAEIISGKETTGYNPLSPPVEACLVGVDRRLGYSAFALKEEDGVLSFQSCWFESIGQGRDASTIRFAEFLNQRTLDTRRQGAGFEESLLVLFEAVLKSMDHYGQNGGFVRMMVLDADATRYADRVIDVCDDTARICIEIVRALREGLVTRDAAERMTADVVRKVISPAEAEKQLFAAVPDPCLLGKILRGFKMSDGGNASSGPERAIFGLAHSTLESTQGGRS